MDNERDKAELAKEREILGQMVCEALQEGRNTWEDENILRQNTKVDTLILKIYGGVSADRV